MPLPPKKSGSAPKYAPPHMCRVHKAVFSFGGYVFKFHKSYEFFRELIAYLFV